METSIVFFECELIFKYSIFKYFLITHESSLGNIRGEW